MELSKLFAIMFECGFIDYASLSKFSQITQKAEGFKKVSAKNKVVCIKN